MFGVIYFFILAVCLPIWTVANEEEWLTLDELENKLPLSLVASFVATTTTSGECFVHCQLRGCSSVAFSKAFQSCKLFDHSNLMTPLPALKDDMAQQHRMYYKALFCPPGWESDKHARQCYLAAESVGDVDRKMAWEVCEANLASTLVTFQTPKQRGDLYNILSSKYSSVTKWWNGYAMYDDRLWPRPVEEIEGYIKRRGDCPGWDIVHFFKSPADCAQLCDRTYRDSCVAFNYNTALGKCWLKKRSCDNPTSQDLDSNYWMYEKAHAGRPPMVTDGDKDCPGNDIMQFHDVGVDQCTKHCRSMPHCKMFMYTIPTRVCYLKDKSCLDKTPQWSGAEFYDLISINDGPCPYGVRFRDVCLNILRSSQTYSDSHWKCRYMGGHFITPIGNEKNAYMYPVFEKFGVFWVDYEDIIEEGNFTKFDLSTKWDDPTYERWGWSPGEPNSASQDCVEVNRKVADATNGNSVTIDDGTCSSSFKSVCETPITQSWPKTCKFTPTGTEYHGTQSLTASGEACKPWSSAPQSGSWRSFPDWTTSHANCRNPDDSIISTGPWCYRQVDDQPEACDIPMCPESDWAAAQVFDDPQKPYSMIMATGSADNYDWTVESRLETATPLCSLPMNEFCPHYFRGSCYRFFMTPKSHDDARAICQNNGWDLVRPETMDEQHFLVGMTQNLGKHWYRWNWGYHIGLKYNSGWKWDDGTIPETLYFGSGQPNQANSCGMLWPEQRGEWHDYYCWFREPFICELKIVF